MQIKKDYTREKIVEVARREFLSKGYAKTSTRDIATGAGIGVSNIYNYFKSKDELFRHIVAPLLSELERMMHEHHNVNDQDQFVRYAQGDGVYERLQTKVPSLQRYPYTVHLPYSPSVDVQFHL